MSTTSRAISRDLKDVAAKTAVTACGDAEATHDGIVERQMSWLDRWIDARMNGTAAPSCTPFATLGGASAPVCATPPTNED